LRAKKRNSSSSLFFLGERTRPHKKTSHAQEEAFFASQQDGAGVALVH